MEGGGGGGELEAEMVLSSMPASFQSYQVVLSVIQYFIPLFIISFAYTRMGVKLWLSQTPGAAQEKRDQMILVNKKKVRKERQKYIFISYKMSYCVAISLLLLWKDPSSVTNGGLDWKEGVNGMEMSTWKFDIHFMNVWRIFLGNKMNIWSIWTNLKCVVCSCNAQ